MDWCYNRKDEFYNMMDECYNMIDDDYRIMDEVYRMIGWMTARRKPEGRQQCDDNDSSLRDKKDLIAYFYWATMIFMSPPSWRSYDASSISPGFAHGLLTKMEYKQLDVKNTNMQNSDVLR